MAPSVASLDGFYEPKCIYVEAKCHEFYNALNTEFKNKYEEFYNYLVNATGGVFKFNVNNGIKKPTVKFSWQTTKNRDNDDKEMTICPQNGLFGTSMVTKSPSSRHWSQFCDILRRSDEEPGRKAT